METEDERIAAATDAMDRAVAVLNEATKDWINGAGVDGVGATVRGSISASSSASAGVSASATSAGDADVDTSNATGTVGFSSQTIAVAVAAHWRKEELKEVGGLEFSSASSSSSLSASSSSSSNSSSINNPTTTVNDLFAPVSTQPSAILRTSLSLLKSAAIYLASNKNSSSTTIDLTDDDDDVVMAPSSMSRFDCAEFRCVVGQAVVYLQVSFMQSYRTLFAIRPYLKPTLPYSKPSKLPYSKPSKLL